MQTVKINHKNSSNILGILILLFSLISLLIFFIKYEIIPIIKIFLARKNFVDEISYFTIGTFSIQIILLYLFIKKLYIGLAYFLSTEECYLEKDALVYSRYLEIFNFYILRFDKRKFNILDIKNISLLPYKKSIGFSTNFIPFWYIYFFTCKNRILIETSNEKLEIWNFRRYPNFFNEEKENDRKELENYFSDIKQLVEKEKIKIIERKKYEEWRSLSVDRRYISLLEKIVKEEKLYVEEIENSFIINYNIGEEKEFYNFLVHYINNIKYQNYNIKIADNNIDCKIISVQKLKEDINEIRDNRSTFKNL